MKIKTVNKPYEEVTALPLPPHKDPHKPSRLLHKILNLAVRPELKKVDFSYTVSDMEKAGDGPWLILMNHSSFLDLEIASEMLKKKPFAIVCTSDGFVGKEGFMRLTGCIPTHKFVTDMGLVSDLQFALHKNGSSVLLYPEASYSFDGTKTPLPRRMGTLFRRLKVPVVMIETFGSFARDPLYNNLRKRKVKVSAVMKCLLSIEELRAKTSEEVDEILDQAFSFDHFKWQLENKVEITEDFRAEGLNRILYKCPACLAEGKTEGKETRLVCRACGKTWEMDVFGQLKSLEGNTYFSHIPDWYAWEREEVRREIEAGTYLLDSEVDIGMIVDNKALYMVGSGRLKHTSSGFVLEGCGGKLHYEQGPRACYSLYSDYYWYEIGDVICIGSNECLYYCFPKEKDIVAKARLATEEIFKMTPKARK